MKKFMIVLLLVALFVSVATASAGGKGAQHASAVLYDLNGQAIGSAVFTEDATGKVHVNVHIKGLAPGLHGIHIHAVGSCSPNFLAAGGHHNPLGHQHGLENPLGAHAGDLPNLVVNPAGVGRLSAVTELTTLSAGPDDQVTDPTGNSGGRVACGVIVSD